MSKRFVIQFKYEMFLGISLFFYLTSNMWINVLNFLPISSIWFTILLIYIPLVLYCILKRKFPSGRAVMLIIVGMLLFLGAYIMFPENAYFFTREMYGVGRVFRPDRPIYIVLLLSMFREPKELLKVLWWSCLIIFMYGCKEFGHAMSVGYWEEYNYAGKLVHFSYSLSFGYKLLVPCLFFGYCYYIKKSSLNLALCLGSFVMILLGGSRGQLLCIAVFVALLMFKSYLNSKSINKLIIIILVMLGIVILEVWGIQNILMQVSMLLHKLGLSSRTLEAMLTGSLTDDNSRLKIWGIAVEMIEKGDFFGYGVYGDRPVISAIHYAGYCHNIFLELMISFGKWPGLLLSIWLIVRSGVIILRAEQDIWYDLFLLFFAVSCQLFLSMSFWYVWAFWATVAISAKCKTNRKAKNNE